MAATSAIPVEEIENMRASLDRDGAVLSPHVVKEIIVNGGFESPALILQTLLIHAWYSKRAL